jgi:peptidoglycan/LPS O-acetylase OafA/YrhL
MTGQAYYPDPVAATNPSASTAPSPAAPRPRRALRVDIQALRAIAVAAVLIYHAGIPWLPGGFVGVDIFFVISGFLITTHLADELIRDGRLSFGRFYARRARRILPASFAVLITTIIAIFAVVPPPLAAGFLRDAVATALYVPNVGFAIQGTDYLAETSPSPFQHYWSLGVEEQFYLFWPLALFLVWRVARGRRRGVLIAAVVLTAASLILGVVATQVTPPWAFFSLPTRAWELGAGAVVALATPAIARLPAGVRLAAALAGFAGIAVSLVLYSPSIAFPGIAASLPVLATAVVIAGGCGGSPAWLDRVLGVAPVQFTGRISYSLYLVHWPLLVVPAVAAGTSSLLSGVPALIALAATVPLAVVLHFTVERPFQTAGWSTRRRPRTILLAALVAGVVVAGAAGAASADVLRRPLDAGQTAAPVPIEPVPVFSDFVPSNLLPSLKDAAADLPATYADGCRVGPDDSALASGCSYGDLGADTVVALWGDSHAAQWVPALEVLAQQQGFRLDVYMKTSCPSVDVPMVTDGVLDVTCNRYRDNVVAALAADPPDRLVISNFAGYDDYGTTGLDTGVWAAGMTALLAQVPHTVDVTVITDTPQFAVTPSTCLAAHLTDALACSLARDEALDAGWRESEATAAVAGGARVVDLNDYLCDPDTCGLIIGDRLLYRDPHHLTASFAATLAPQLSEKLGWDAP